ncbi:CapA family protein [Desulfobotulus sp.]|jgi:UDP-N-acetylmuramyl pentapeptide synthase/poly-gamma-glutamate capsule biosynthesis protein CapA/YwtB (metallophosphatase superfamily)|uniref:CapA family protein n=1 Tax=Desulfobotulus sp. TaxID=1940337 RepID=UPI002A35B89C|nr:CapA family protein [Desulfobotulus sp.]MDY0164343.1 CapA family protein [Desulfobotulus sp.]
MTKRKKKNALASALRAQHALKKKQSQIRANTHFRPLRTFLKACPDAWLTAMLEEARPVLEQAIQASCQKRICIFLSFTDGVRRARVLHAPGYDFGHVWKNLMRTVQQVHPKPFKIRWLRVDWIQDFQEKTWAELKRELSLSKRNYFRYGIALDENFNHAFLEMELNANAMLYPEKEQAKAELNEANFVRYAKTRFGNGISPDFSDDKPVCTFTTEAILFQPGKAPLCLHGYSGGKEGRDTGRRILEQLDRDTACQCIRDASIFLADQLNAKGRFVYGMHPCFDREINTYNTLRHASTTYSMLEAWEVTQSESLKAAIDRSLGCLTKELIRSYSLADGRNPAFLVDLDDEIKLGGNAVCLLALVKYTELTEDNQFLPLMESLGLGILLMQNPDTGQFCHVLHAGTLKIKEQFRIIYYDGEAAFGLMRLYGLTKDERWLRTVEKAFEYFIAKNHWRANDHWLSYCVNELTLYRPEEKYYRFGIENVAGHLDFVLERITTFPTLLELMMAAHKMIVRLKKDPDNSHLLHALDMDKFYHALEHRARYLLNGHFWPEFAMFFENPQRILGSFFIRHHAFRVRIDDVEHYLSGFVTYLHHYLDGASSSWGGDFHDRPDHGEKSVQDVVPEDAEETKKPDFDSSPYYSMKSCAKIVWGGDVNLGRRQHYRTRELSADRVLDLKRLRSADLSIVNLECVVATTGKQGIPKGEGGPYYYRARPEMLEILTSAGVDVVTLANNHSGDYGPAALWQQSLILDDLGIGHAGTGYDLNTALKPVFRRAGDLNVAIFSIDTTQHRFAAGHSSPGTAWLPMNNPAYSHDMLRPRIEKARETADIVFVAVHWGDNHASEPDANEIRFGHTLIDAGADAVLGASAHRLQGMEVYRNRPIIHDAGDLLFDSVRSNLADSGLFELEACHHGVLAVHFIPVGTGFGFSECLHGQEAFRVSSHMQELSFRLGTKLQVNGDGTASLRLNPEPKEKKYFTPAPFTRYRPETLLDYRPGPDYGQVAGVPAAYAIDPVSFQGIQLLGIRVDPVELKQRSMLWVESWWLADAPVAEDYRIDCRAVPVKPCRMPEWGREMDHDPCDWMQPTGRWVPGRIYRDFYGLRPPQMNQLENIPLQVEVRITGKDKADTVYVHPEKITLAIPGKDTPSPLRYRTEFPADLLTCQPGRTWTAEQLALVTGGKWLVPPEKGWFVRSIVNGKKHLPMRPGPTLFAAHTNHERKRHEGSTQPVKGLGDRHLLLAEMAHELGGAIVSRPVPDLPIDFPQLLVADPIKAIMELGFAARQRFAGPVIAVTGTAGKSTTVALIKTLFEEGQCLASVDNYNSRVGAPLQLASLSQDYRAAVIEVAQSALWMQRGPVTRLIRPTVSLITEIGLSQTRSMVKTIKDVARWKSRIFDGLVPGGTAILGEHLPHYDTVLSQAQRHAGRIITFGSSEGASLRILGISALKNGSRLTLALNGAEKTMDIPFKREGMLHNAMAALAVAHALDMDLKVSADRMYRYVPDEGRMQHAVCSMSCGDVYIIDDSWNAVVISMLNAFLVLKDSPCEGRKIAVLGRIVHLGDMAPELHAQLATPLMETGVAHVLTHGEEMFFLREKLPKGMLGPHFDKAAPLCDYLENFLKNKDLVLLKGSRRDSDFGDISKWFSGLRQGGR